MTGWGAGNPVSDPLRESAAEEAKAGGLGSYTAFHAMPDKVEAKGIWKDGTWYVVFRRPLLPADKERMEFKRGKKFSIAFAVWDGFHKDRNGQKMVSIWNELKLES